ncbi:MAG: haloacid dehalogenase type II [Gemmatimonadaceae bacterium]|nr:haloacid dehalogenase type II [Gemmatimonadaceae bacterium]NUQ94076.1 haloacid dehalogenase type II [Gemmatimonadaceae bacterium]NUR21105.1 haloacid dehalogenase type II [Gemmatimonadaceae bacterium]NUS98256.1 haloacid dehalogenase type II [Gemmatimonadaceae bacterium]
MKPVIVFDMNETLLDMSALDATFGRIFGHPQPSELRKRWFEQVLQLFLTATVIGRYRPFDKLTQEALGMLARQQGREASAEDRKALEAALGKIPAYPDARPGLERLKAAGFVVATLTNSTEKAAERLLEQAGLRPLFDRVLSADEVKRYKPAPEAYAYAAKELEVKPREVLLVAAHAWDIAGALAAGCRAAFIERPGKVMNPEGPQPELSARDVQDLAEQLVAKHG